MSTINRKLRWRLIKFAYLQVTFNLKKCSCQETQQLQINQLNFAACTFISLFKTAACMDCIQLWEIVETYSSSVLNLFLKFLKNLICVIILFLEQRLT